MQLTVLRAAADAEVVIRQALRVTTAITDGLKTRS